MTITRQVALALLILGPLPAPGTGAQGPQAAPALDPARPGWSSLDFGASKWMIDAQTRIEARLLPGASVREVLRTPPQGRPVGLPPEVLEVTYVSRGAGREFHTRLLADPADGASLQSEQRDGGSRQRERTYRFTDIGAWHFTRWPATAAERNLAPAQWTRVEEGLRAYPAAAVGRHIGETSALLWIIAASGLTEPGDTIEVLTFSRREVSRVDITATGWRRVPVTFTEVAARVERPRRGDIDALVLRLRAEPLDPTADPEDFELLGLRGELELLLDPETRAPLALRGRVRLLGEVVVRLERLTLR